ncbi:MAG: type II toxin-antitoxin system RelE/ParE family toxin [Acidobacteriota bacterium]
MKIAWADPAVDDLQAVHDYIGRDSEKYASHFVARILDAVEGLRVFPHRGRQVRETPDHPDVRELLFQTYRIVYRAEEARVLVLAVVHGSRDLSRLRPWTIG